MTPPVKHLESEREGGREGGREGVNEGEGGKRERGGGEIIVNEIMEKRDMNSSIIIMSSDYYLQNTLLLFMCYIVDYNII